MAHIERFDLNLLGPLVALLEERHVSRAAERVALSQPAMSRTLRRLRSQFGDELLVRSSEGYRLTPLAERLHRRLSVLVPHIENVFEPREFVPEKESEIFRISGTDYAVSVIGVELFSHVMRVSPRSQVHFRTWHDSVFEDIDRGVLDLVLYGALPPSPLRREPIFEEEFVCVVSDDHPLADRVTLCLEDYLSCSHVIIDVASGLQGVVDAQMSARGVARRPDLIVPYHLTALAAVTGTELVATLPRRMVLGYEGVRLLTPPDIIGPMAYSMVWHPRMDNDPAQVWLRDVVRVLAGAS